MGQGLFPLTNIVFVFEFTINIRFSMLRLRRELMHSIILESKVLLLSLIFVLYRVVNLIVKYIHVLERVRSELYTFLDLIEEGGTNARAS